MIDTVVFILNYRILFKTLEVYYELGQRMTKSKFCIEKMKRSSMSIFVLL